MNLATATDKAEMLLMLAERNGWAHRELREQIASAILVAYDRGKEDTRAALRDLLDAPSVKDLEGKADA